MQMNIEAIREAARRLRGRARVTPLLSAPLLDQLAGRRVLVKAECLQETGSFKFRGAWTALTALPEEVRAQGVIAFSSGNHAQGVARAAQLLGVPAVIVMPSDAPKLKLANTRAYGAEVVLYDRETEDRDAIGAELASKRGLTLVKPFDDPQVIAGQGTVGIEIAAQAAEAGVIKADVIVPASGGGLAAGVAVALEAEAPGLRLRTAEPEGFDDIARSLAAGAVRRNPRLTGSIQDAILAPEPGRLTFPILQRLAGPGIAVSDDAAMRAMAAAALRLKLALEPGGAAALAAALSRGHQIEGDTVIVVASGGNVDAAQLIQALGRFGGAV
jgi:threonine dehydratase